MSSYFRKGTVVALTGAASGIGREIAFQLTRTGASVAMADIDALALRSTAQQCASASTHTHELDVADPDAVERFAADTVEQFGRVDAVINVAGVLYSGSVDATPLADHHRVMDVNYWGVVNSTKAFLPRIAAASGAGRICNISSAFGIMASPNSSAYNASKFAVRGFTEALIQELAATAPNIKVTGVYPGGVRTSIARTARVAPGVDHATVSATFDRLARTDAAISASTIVRGVERGSPKVMVGPDARLVDVATRVLGSGYMRVIPALRKRM